MKENIPEVLFEKIEYLASMILNQDLSKEALTEALLLYFCDDMDIKKEVRLNKMKRIEVISENIRSVHGVKSVTKDVNLVIDNGIQNRPQSYRYSVTE